MTDFPIIDDEREWMELAAADGYAMSNPETAGAGRLRVGQHGHMCRSPRMMATTRTMAAINATKHHNGEHSVLSRRYKPAHFGVSCSMARTRALGIPKWRTPHRAHGGSGWQVCVQPA